MGKNLMGTNGWNQYMGEGSHVCKAVYTLYMMSY